MRKMSSSSSVDAIIAGTITAGGGRDFTGAAMRGVAGLDGAVAGAGTAGEAAAIATDISASVAVSGVVLAFTVAGPGWVAALLE
jgi:hypothetical protein